MRNSPNYLTISYVIGGLALFSSCHLLADETMVVTAAGFAQEVKHAPASISVISKPQLENKPYRDITDALKDVPGVHITGSGDATDISIRGMDAKYTLILIDGVRVRSRESRPNSDGAGFEQGWLPPLAAIERIEVVRGPMSSRYGSDAMGGVINIITKKITDSWQSNLRLEATSPQESQATNSYTTNFSTTGPLIDNLIGLQLYGQYADRNEDDYLHGHPEQRLRSLNGKLSLTPSAAHQFDLTFGRSLQNSYATRGKTRDPANRSDFERYNQRNNIALSHQANWGLATSKTTWAYESTDNTVRDMRTDNSDLDSQLLIPIGQHMLTIGGKYSYQKLNDKGNQLTPSLTQIDRWDYALFLEDEWQLVDSVALIAGLRYNRDEMYGSNWNPRLYGVWDISENYTLKGGISTGYTTPSLRYVVEDWGQTTGGGSSSGVIIGNSDLDPEKSINYEIGLNYTNDEQFNASITAFYTKFKDKIQSYYLCQDQSRKGNCSINGIGGFDFVQSRENVDKADIKGVEFSLTTPIYEHFTLAINYNWMKTEQKTGVNKGMSLNRTPRHKLNSQLDWQTTDQLTLWSKVAYYGEETAAGRNGVRGTRYPGYTLWDLGGYYRITTETKLYAGIYNLFDKLVNDDDFDKTLDGRSFWVGVDMNF